MGHSFNISWPLWYAIIPTLMGLYWFFNKNAGSAKPYLTLLLVVWMVRIGAYYYEKNGKQDAFKSPLAGVSAQAARTRQQGSGAIQVTDETNGEQIFEHFAISGAARLSSLDRQQNGDWLATFTYDITDAAATTSAMRGWFERPTDQHPPQLLCYRSFFGTYRVEDQATGKTLFLYHSGTHYKPVNAKKKPTSKWQMSWQVLFSAQTE